MTSRFLRRDGNLDLVLGVFYFILGVANLYLGGWSTPNYWCGGFTLLFSGLHIGLYREIVVTRLLRHNNRIVRRHFMLAIKLNHELEAKYREKVNGQ